MKRTLVGASLALALTACATSRDMTKPLEVWHNFDAPNISQPQLAENQSMVVFYRQDDVQGPAVNVYVNGDYQASLLPNAYSTVAVCATRNLMTSSFTLPGFGNRTQGVYYTSPVNEVTYVKVSQDVNGELSFVRVEKAIAEQVIAKLPRGTQTLSRVKTHCGEVVLANAELGAGALFKFNKSSYQDILPQGKKEIADFSAKIATLAGATKVVVSGHTDPEGTASYNQRLSQQRAETVKKALQNAGITLPIEAVGYGKNQPVVTHCASLNGVAKQECNQPNRRVEITVYGNK
ncbi:OmpA family protein [Pelistega ratti]|uniref:OmpA family protein n=1 Tax=Pelistega ratti TaxID=2652177 RepID=UPI001357FD22|nr:OmpA family protein [Pelistega ratti]